MTRITTSAPSETTALLNDAHINSLERTASITSRGSRYGSLSGLDEGLDEYEEDFDTTYKSEAKLLAQYSIPLIITYLLQYSYNLVTVFVAGQLGTNELAAASLASMTANVTGLCVYEGLATCLDTLTSQAYGAGKKKLVGLHVQRMIALMMATTIPIGAVWIASPWILSKLVPEKDTALLAGRFLQIYLLGMPGFAALESGKRFTQAQGVFTASLVPVLICAPLNLVWNWLLVFRLDLRFEGAALAAAVSNTLQPIVLLIYIRFFAKHTLECWPGWSLKQTMQNWGQMIRLGVPGVLMVLSEWLAFDILAFASSYLGKEFLAAQSVLMSVAVTMYHIPMPVSVAAATRFGNLIGHGALTAARKLVRLAFMVFAAVGIMDVVLLTSLRHIIASAFTGDEVVRQLVVSTLPLVAAAQTFDAMAVGANGLLRGLGRQKIGGWVNLCVYYIEAVPLSLFLAFGPAKLGLLGLWMGPLTGLGIVFTFVTIYITRSDWRKAVEEARAREE